MLQGNLDMLILKTPALGTARRHSIARAIERDSIKILQMEHGSLCPTPCCLEDRGWIASFPCIPENNRKAKYHLLTPVGRFKRLRRLRPFQATGNADPPSPGTPAWNSGS